jgi:protein ImuB
MPLAEARTLLPHARFLPHDPDADHAALRELCWHCHRYSPLVGVEDFGFWILDFGLERKSKIANPKSKIQTAESLFLDTTGCTHLFGGESSWAERVHADLTARGFTVRVALADTPGAAWAVAHYQSLLETTVIPPGEHHRALDPLPVEALRLPDDILRTLHELDLRTIGALRRLPRDTLPSRFGSILLQRLDQALGDAPELIVPEHPPEPLEVRQTFEFPLQDRRAVDAAIQSAVTRLTEQLAARGLGVQRLECELSHQPDAPARDVRHAPSLARRAGVPQHPTPHVFTLNLIHPTADPRRLLELLDLRLERTQLPAEVTDILIRAEELRPLGARQRLFFDDPDHTASELAALIERLSSRMGENTVLRPQLASDHQPELGVDWTSGLRRPTCPAAGLSEAGYRGVESPPAQTNPAHTLRPLCLLSAPSPVAATSIIPDGPPIRFTWQGREHVVARCRGPERIETGWWRERHVQRDYYAVETTEGRWFWVFRERTSGDWYVHGVFE